MAENSENEILNTICREAKAEGKLSGKNLTELYDLFGPKIHKSTRNSEGKQSEENTSSNPAEEQLGSSSDAKEIT